VRAPLTSGNIAKRGSSWWGWAAFALPVLGLVAVFYGHQDRPSHSFALVNQEDASITWIKHYAEMFVPTNQFLDDLGAA
jgi:hypothetical protein